MSLVGMVAREAFAMADDRAQLVRMHGQAEAHGYQVAADVFALEIKHAEAAIVWRASEVEAMLWTDALGAMVSP